MTHIHQITLAFIVTQKEKDMVQANLKIITKSCFKILHFELEFSQLSEAFLHKGVCYSFAFSHIFSVFAHHQGGWRQL